jgi:hypothetical protein
MKEGRSMKKLFRGIALITVAAVTLFSSIVSVSASEGEHGNNGNAYGKQKHEYKTNYSSVILESSSVTADKSIVLKFSGNIKEGSDQSGSEIMLMKGSKKSIPVTVYTSSSSSLIIKPGSDFTLDSAYKLYVFGLKDSKSLVIKPFSLVINKGNSDYNDEENDDTENIADINGIKFSDVDKDFWAYSAIMELVNRGIIKGYTDKTFKPNEVVTRSEFATMFTKTLNLTSTGNTQTFADISPTSWDYQAVEAAKYYMTGFRQSDGTIYFYGNNAAVREDMAVALVKALNISVESNNAVLQQLYTDYNQISANLRDYVYTAYKNGLMVGSNNQFNPQGNLTRAEAATLLQRALKSEKIVIVNGEKVVIGGGTPISTDDKEARLGYLRVNGTVVSDFSPDKLTYNVNLPDGTTTLPIISASALNLYGAAVSITQPTTLPGYGVVVVTSKDKTTVKTYLIYFTVLDEIDHDATLRAVTVNGTPLNGFASTIYNYNVTLPTGTTTIPTVAAAVNDTNKAHAFVLPALSLPGTTTIVVTAEDGITTCFYTIKFTVAN